MSVDMFNILGIFQMYELAKKDFLRNSRTAEVLITLLQEFVII